MNEKKGFVLYFDSYENLVLLNDEQRGKLFLALYKYAAEVREGAELSPTAALQYCPDLEPSTAMAFCFMANHIQRDTQHWLKRRGNYQRAAAERWESRRGQEGGDKKMARYVQELQNNRDRADNAEACVRESI